MKRSVTLLSVLSAGALLGCSQFAQAPAQREAVATAGSRASVLNRARPPEPVAGAQPETEHLWLQGRAAQNRGELALAQAHYARVLQGQPAHVGALNAMAVILAQTDRLDQAIPLFQQALALQPRASHLFNNLGYALLLAGRLNEAESALGRAHELNPASELTRYNRELLAQARARGAAVVASPAETNEPAASPGLVALAPNVYLLRDPVPAAPTAQARAELPVARPAVEVSRQTRAAAPTAAPQATQAELHGVRLEVSNGVGVRHMARRTAERLAPLGLVAVRLTNQPGFRQARTELQFGAGQAGAAQALAVQMPQAPHVVPAKQLAGKVQLRLLLGHDQVGKAVLAWLDESALREEVAQTPPQPQPVALNLRQGWRWS